MNVYSRNVLKVTLIILILLGFTLHKIKMLNIFFTFSNFVKSLLNLYHIIISKTNTNDPINFYDLLSKFSNILLFLTNSKIVKRQMRALNRGFQVYQFAMCAKKRYNFLTKNLKTTIL